MSATALTLFHAGRVYDYMEELGEVVILEPVHNRFTVLGPNYLAARVEQAIIYAVSRKLKSLQAGAMGYSTTEVGDLVAEAVANPPR